jgi:ribosomal protein L37E
MELLLLYRRAYNNKYISADNSFDGQYTVRELLHRYPRSYLLLMNDDTSYDLERVVNRSQINLFFNIDTHNNLTCTNCKHKYYVSTQYCPNCGYENIYYEITKYLADEMKKSIETNIYVLYDFWEDTEHREVV